VSREDEIRARLDAVGAVTPLALSYRLDEGDEAAHALVDYAPADLAYLLERVEEMADALEHYADASWMEDSDINGEIARAALAPIIGSARASHAIPTPACQAESES
jgi:hypothetical protein